MSTVLTIFLYHILATKREIFPFKSLNPTKPAWSQLSHTDTMDGLDRSHS